MSKLLSGLDGIVCQMDDVLIFGKTKEEHDIRLTKALDRIHSAGVTLNREKCLFGQDNIKFLGHVVNKQGISADPDKVAAITQMKAPQNISALRQFLGMVSQLGKFSPRLATITQPMREHLSKKANWHWSVEQQAAFDTTKDELLQPTVLVLYNPKAKTKVSADASSFGLGAVLLQQDDRGWHPVAFASRSLSEVEQRYAQIEKEALATVWACEKFAAYLVGGIFSIETDHKPLVPLLSTKHLDCLPPRVLRFRLRLDQFDYTIHHVPGKELYTVDALSRAPSSVAGIVSHKFQTELEEFIDTITSLLPASKDHLEEYRSAQKEDSTCSMIRYYCENGWPHKSRVLK